MVHQLTYYSKHLFFSFFSGFFTHQLHYLTSNSQIHHCLPTSSLLINLVSLSFNLLTASILSSSFHIFLVIYWIRYTYRQRLKKDIQGLTTNGE